MVDVDRVGIARRLSRGFIALFLGLTAATLLTRPVMAQKAVQGQPVGIEEADRILRERERRLGPSIPDGPSAISAPQTSLLSGAVASTCPGGTAQPVEITTLAQSLKCNPDLIFEYVYNNIEYEPLFGSNKGAVGTLVDGIGNDWDQAQLLVALLRAAGATSPQFQYGYIRLTGVSAVGWLGVKDDAFAIRQTIINGGIPIGNMVYNPDGTLYQLDIAHIWVTVNIGGTNYVFDPSFKQHTIITGFPALSGVLGYNKANFIADAGASTDPVSIRGINRSKLRGDLADYARNLIRYIKSNNPAASMPQAIGGKIIVPLAGSPVRQTSLPNLSPVQPIGIQTWTAVPNAYRACMAVSMPGISTATCATATSQTIVLYPDEIYSQRVTVFSVPAAPGYYVPTLRIDGNIPSGGISTGPSTLGGANWPIYLAISHPYPTAGADDAKSLNVMAGGSYLISTGWGTSTRGMVQHHRQKLNAALAVLGADPSSEPILGESLSVIGFNWLAEASAAYGISGQLLKMVPHYHHSAGIVAQTAIQGLSSTQGPYVDLPLITSSWTSQTCWPIVPCAFTPDYSSAFFANSGVGSSLESAVLLQTQAPTPNMSAVSTVSLIDKNVGTQAKTFFADGTTTGGVSTYFGTIRPQLIGYSVVDLSSIDHAISTTGTSAGSPTGYQVLMPANGHQTVGLWSGAGYTVIQSGSTSVTILQKITGGLSGGFSGTDIPYFALNQNTIGTIFTPPASPDVAPVFNTQPSTWGSTISDPIDVATGANLYSHTDLTIGSSSFPYSLPFARNYASSSNMDDIGLGKGWRHGYQLSAVANSDPYEGLGASSPIRSAAAIAALYVSQDLLNSSSQNATSLTLAWVVSQWLTDQITNNAVFVNRPDAVEEFVALPWSDGASSFSYDPPFGTAVDLVGTNVNAGKPTGFTYTTRDQTRLAFGATAAGAISSWSWSNGMRLDFSYDSTTADGKLTQVSNNLGRSLTLSYGSDGIHLASVSDGSRSIAFAYAGSNLDTALDPVGTPTRYVYDDASHLTQIFYPSNPATPYVTNSYDGLGRVSTQTNANGASSTFYFSGSRTEIVDAAGARHVTYQNPRGRIVSDTYVLNPAFGQVFGDTVTQSGTVNVTGSQYDGRDRLILRTAPEGGTTAYAYAPGFEADISQVTQNPKPGSPLSPLITSFVYDTTYGKPTRITDPRGLVTLNDYDTATGNLTISTKDAGAAPHFNATASATYNSVGQVLAATDPLGVVTGYAYDAMGNQVSIIRDAGRTNVTSSMAYDALGNVVSLTDPNGAVTTSSYDLNRLRTQTVSPATPAAPSGLVTNLTYDPDGRLLQTAVSANGTLLQSTGTTYTPTGQKATTTDANGKVTTFGYDAVDRLARITDPVGRVTTYLYDAMGRQTQILNTAIQSAPLVQQAYTPDGQIASRTVARSNAVFNVTGFAYDGFDRTATATYPDSSTQAYGYDANGNVLTAKNRAGGTLTFTYDTLNRVATKTPPSPAPVVTYTYDLAGHLIGANDNSSAIVAALPPSGGTVSYATTISYDALNRPLGVSWTPAATGLASASATNSSAFTYNAANQRISQTASDNSWLSYPAATPGTTGYTANNLDQYTAVGAITPTYDGNGNLTYDGSFTLGYDAESRLISASGGGTTASYAFDAQGRRKQKTVNGAKTVFVTDADDRVVLDYDGTTGQIQRWYAYGLGPNDVLGQNNVAAATRTTLIPDVQGSYVATLDSGSGLLSKAAFQPFGQSATTTGTYRYTGARIDPETNGLYHMRARAYSPTLGRFLQADPIGVQGGYNIYVYVLNDPLNGVDPSGHVREPNFGFSSFASTMLLPGITASETIGIGGAGLAGAFMLPLALSGDTPLSQNARQFVYVTYTRTDPVSGLVYSGRTSGFATPSNPVELQAIATQRGYSQPILNSEGFALPRLDQATNNYAAIRGREQQLIDFYGGARSVGGAARNSINGISDYNPLRPYYMDSSTQMFGPLPSNRP